MKTFLISLVLGWSLSALAVFPNANIQELTGSYENSAGKAQAKYFMLNEYDFGADVDFDVEKQGNSVYLTTGDDEIEFKELPLAVDDLHKLKWTKLNLMSTQAKIDLALGSLAGQYIDKSMGVRGLRLVCDSAGENISDHYLNSCLNNKGHISFSKLDTISNGKKTTIENLSFSTSGGRLRFSVKASARVKGKGTVTYKDNKVVIKITEAKSGPFSVRKKFFQELRKLQSANIEVKRPYITISL